MRQRGDNKRDTGFKRFKVGTCVLGGYSVAARHHASATGRCMQAMHVGICERRRAARACALTATPVARGCASLLPLVLWLLSRRGSASALCFCAHALWASVTGREHPRGRRGGGGAAGAGHGVDLGCYFGAVWIRGSLRCGCSRSFCGPRGQFPLAATLACIALQFVLLILLLLLPLAFVLLLFLLGRLAATFAI